MSTASWITDANGSGFDLDNLPFGVVRPAGSDHGRPVARIGDHCLDLAMLASAGALDLQERLFREPALNSFIACGRDVWRATRARLRELLGDEANRSRVAPALMPLDGCTEQLPVRVGDYIDFYASLEHAQNLGRLFRPGTEPLLPNWRHLPVGYHGRSGTIVVSRTGIVRPYGQRAPDQPGAVPTFGPERRLDIEIELGFITGDGPSGRPVTVDEADEYIFGYVLVNDWSAREIQRWEYQPLGPFLGKSFATTISAWIVAAEALAERRVTGPAQDPRPLPYLRHDEPRALDVALQADLIPRGARRALRLSDTNARHLYWSPEQQLAHATSNGATFRAGDLFASGTISGPSPESLGSLVEITSGGTAPIHAGDVERSFLEDGDTVVITGAAGSVSFGECRGTVVAGPPGSG